MDDTQLRSLENSLGYALPSEYRQFVQQYGFFATNEWVVAGLDERRMEAQTTTDAFALTNYCRNRFGLPPDYLVVTLSEDEFATALAVSHADPDGNCGVFGIEYRPDAEPPFCASLIAKSFSEFFCDYVQGWLEDLDGPID